MSASTEILQPQAICGADAAVLLDASRLKKTLDFGSDGVACSIGELGDIISLLAYHPKHGMVCANPFEQFPGGDKFWDSSFVRSYRRKFLDCFNWPGSGFGLKVMGTKKEIEVSLVDGRWPRINYAADDVLVESNFCVTHGFRPVVVNCLNATNPTNDTTFIDVRFGGEISINRASYGQLTETSPVTIPPSLNQLRYKNNCVSIANPNLPATMHCALYSEKSRNMLNGADQESSQPIHIQHSFRFEIPPHSERQLTAVFCLDPSSTEQFAPQLDLLVNPISSGFLPDRKGFGKDTQNFVIRRTLDYILSCCCIPIHDRAICVLTDHVALPLGWNRDN
jgi:uncharacterized protein